MRLIDFLIYYTTKLYENKSRGTLFWDSPIKRGSFNVTLTLTLWFFAIVTLLVFFIFRVNLFLLPYIKLIIPLIGLLIYQLVAYIYITKDRYEIIKSSTYNSFNWREKNGAAISFLLFVGGIIISLVAEVIMDALQK